jgi:hypothetical protein
MQGTEISDEPPCKDCIEPWKYQEGSRRAAPVFHQTVLHAGILELQKKKPEE